VNRGESGQGPENVPGRQGQPSRATGPSHWPPLRGPADTAGTSSPGQPSPADGAADRPPVAPSPRASGPTPVVVAPPVPPEEKPLDPRQIARASLAAGRNASLWWVSAGVVVATAVAVVAGMSWGALSLALMLVAAAVARAVAPEGHPAALAVRSRPIDVAVLLGFAFAVGVLSQIVPAG